MQFRTWWMIGAGIAVCAVSGWVLSRNSRTDPQTVWRMGYENNPPNMQVAADGTISGLVIEVVRDAAARAGVRLQWVRAENQAEPLASTQIDLWPILADLPERRLRMHLTDPWLQTHYMVLYRPGASSPTQEFTGRVGHYSQRLHYKLVAKNFPKASGKVYSSRQAMVPGLCAGEVDAVFLEERLAGRYLARDAASAPPCPLLASPLSEVFVQFSMGSTARASGAADRIREEIGEMARDGSLALHLMRYSNNGVHDATAAFELAQTQQAIRWLRLIAMALGLLLAALIWQNRQLRSARRAAETGEAKLRESEARIRTLLEQAADLIAVVDDSGKLTYESPSCVRVLGAAGASLLGHDFVSLVHAEDAEIVRNTIASVAEGSEAPVRLRFRVRHGNGEEARSVQATFQRLPDNEGLHGILINASDITEELRLQDQLRQSHKMEAIGRLAGGIAHDFNNLLTVINGYASLLIAKAPDEGTQRRELGDILSAGQRAAGLTQQLLAFSRKQVIAPRLMQLNDVVRESMGLLERIVGDDVTIQAVLVPDAGMVRLDPNQIHQVIMNLAANARDAMPKGGSLVIETYQEFAPPDPGAASDSGGSGAFAALRVTDDGVGMDAATLQSIFDPFFTTKEVGRGTGLGLATVHGIVNQSGGRITVESEVGRGTTFRIYFPLAAAQPELST